MKRLLLSIFIGSFVYSMQGQTNVAGTRFEIGEYEIDVAEEGIYKCFGGYTHYYPDGSMTRKGDWDWLKYNLDFKTTSLIFVGSHIKLKEVLRIPTTDISSLKVIQQSIGYNYNLTYVLSSSENKVYVIYDNGIDVPIDVSDYTHIRQLIFKNKNGKLFYIPVGGFYIIEITIPIDEASLQHVFAGYYADKNGLYYFEDTYNGAQQQLESSNGEPVQVVLYERYFIYGDAAYPYRGSRNPKDLRLNVNELSLFNSPLRGVYLGDANKLFPLSLNIEGYIGSSLSPTDIIRQGAPKEPVSEWIFFDTAFGSLKENTFYYPNGKSASGNYYDLIKTPNGFYGITGFNKDIEAVKLDNVMIYNIEKDDYEPIEIDQFRQLSGMECYIYKNRMYDDDNSRLIETELDIQKLQAICLNGRATRFYTDGTFLVVRYYNSLALFRDVDWESLQVVTDMVMVDKNNIYQVNRDVGMLITPIKKLGLDVKVIPLMDKQQTASTWIVHQ